MARRHRLFGFGSGDKRSRDDMPRSSCKDRPAKIVLQRSSCKDRLAKIVCNERPRQPRIISFVPEVLYSAAAAQARLSTSERPIIRAAGLLGSRDHGSIESKS